MFILIVLGATVLGMARPPSAGVDPPSCKRAEAAACRQTEAVRGCVPEHVQPPAPVGASLGLSDVVHHHLDIELDPANDWLGGSNTMTISSEVEGLSSFVFRLHDLFTLSTVQVNGQPAAWQRLDSANVQVTLSPPMGLGQVFELEVAYNGFPSPTGFGSIIFRERSGAPEVWTLSEPWFAYTWWPAKDDSSDKTTADLWFTVPEGMVVASNGLLLGSDVLPQDRVRYRWQTQYPTADYLYCFGATNYDTFEADWDHPGGTMPLQFYIYPEDNTPGNRDLWLLNLEMLDVFSGLYGTYPFADEKYGMCQVGFAGGMEHQTMTSQGGFWDTITAHELGHQWWGDMVTCATWHDIWLNEGFATYSEALWAEHRPGSSGAPELHAVMETKRPSAVNDSVYVYDLSSVSRIFSSNFSYRKGAWVLHMLRHVVGDAVFFEILDAYRQAHAYGSATTEDFRAVAEQVCACDLQWFFEQWIYDIGAPRYAYAWRNITANGQGYVEIYIAQVQNEAYPVFTMPMDVRTESPGNEALHVLMNDAEAEHFLVAVDGPAQDVELDPDTWILATAVIPVAFVEGPPKIVALQPAPGSSSAPAEVGEIRVSFHKSVVVSAGQISLQHETEGPVGCAFSYDAPSAAAVLTPLEPLAAGDYQVLVADSVVDAVAGLPMDGEVTAEGAAGLPSGDGLPGGTAVLAFNVFADCNANLVPDSDDLGAGASSDLNRNSIPDECEACVFAPADVNQDGDVDLVDLLCVLDAFTGSFAACPTAQTDVWPCAGDGVVDLLDILATLDGFTGLTNPCCKE